MDNIPLFLHMEDMMVCLPYYLVHCGSEHAAKGVIKTRAGCEWGNSTPLYLPSIFARRNLQGEHRMFFASVLIGSNPQDRPLRFTVVLWNNIGF
jgi:hypothetical protein